MENYFNQLPLLLLYAFCIYCLPIVVYRYFIRKYAMTSRRAAVVSIVYMFCGFLISSAIRYGLSAETVSVQDVPILWGFVDYYMLTHISPRDIKKVNVRGFSRRVSYCDSEKQQVVIEVAPKVLRQCYQLRLQKKELTNYLNALIEDNEISLFHASVLYQEYMKTETAADMIFEKLEDDSTESNESKTDNSERTKKELDIATRKHRKGWGWSIAALVAWIPFLFFLLAVVYNWYWDPFSTTVFFMGVLGFVLHIVFYLNPRNINSKGAVVSAIYNLIVIFTAFLVQTVSCIEDDWVLVVPILVIASVVPLLTCYILHLCKSYRNTPKAVSARISLRQKEKAYAKIAKFHEYKLQGIMTEEEFEKCKAQILAELEK